MEAEFINITEDGGVTKQILKAAPEDAQSPEDGMEVEVHYIGTLASDGSEFDRSSEPFTFSLGAGQVIKGWDIGVKTMKKGEKALFTLSSDYAYGANGSPPKIPANATLKFEVELLGFQEKEKTTKRDFSEEERRAKAKEFKVQGNEAFKKGDLNEARRQWEEAWSWVVDDSDPVLKEHKLAVALNLALVFVKLGDASQGKKYAEEALKIDDKNVKALYRLAQVQGMTGSFEEAIETLSKALIYDPNNEDVKFKKILMAKNLKREQEKEKKLFSKMFSKPIVEEEVVKTDFSDPTNPVVYLEVQIGSEPAQKLEFELFKNVVPKTVENFRALCTGEKGVGNNSGKPLHYKGSVFHRLIKGFMIQGGDFENANGTGGESIYGGKFDDENFKAKHAGRGYLAMANAGPNTNGSQFYITFGAQPHLDGKHVVFGVLKSNQEFLNRIENAEESGSKPKEEIRIVDCGVVSA
jgi:peptidylprolyl isomerase